MSNHNAKTSEDKQRLRMVMQYREKRSMVYEMLCNGVELDVRVSPRETSEDAGEWRVEARAGRSPNAVCIAEWAPTRLEALSAVGRKWVSAVATGQLPAFDWQAVTSVLDEVRALQLRMTAP